MIKPMIMLPPYEIRKITTNTAQSKEKVIQSRNKWNWRIKHYKKSMKPSGFFIWSIKLIKLYPDQSGKKEKKHKPPISLWEKTLL